MSTAIDLERTSGEVPAAWILLSEIIDKWLGVVKKQAKRAVTILNNMDMVKRIQMKAIHSKKGEEKKELLEHLKAEGNYGEGAIETKEFVRSFYYSPETTGLS